MRTAITFTAAMLFMFCPLRAWYSLGDAPQYNYSAEIIEALRPLAAARQSAYDPDANQHEYYSRPQAVGNYVLFEGSRAERALNLIEQNFQFDALLRQIKPKDSVSNLLLTVNTYIDVRCDVKQSVFGWTGVCDLRHSVDIDADLDVVNTCRRGDWLFKYIDAPEYKYKGLQAFYLVTDFQQTRIPSGYAQYINYLDQMTNPMEDVLFDDAKCCRHDTCYAEVGAFDNFLQWLVPIASGDSLPDEYDYYDVLNNPDDSCFARIDRLMAGTKLFHRMLDLAVESAFEHQCYFELLEELAARYRSNELALRLKRSHFPVPDCCMDSSPFMHRRAIALLAAQTAEWNIFLRTHLDLFYDDYRKNPDGTYEFLGDRTMIPVMQEFGLDVKALLLGSVLNAGNRHKNAHSARTYNIGNVIARMPDHENLLQDIRSMIGDRHLDDFNRLRLLAVYWKCLFNCRSGESSKSIITKLRSAVALLPPYLVQTIDMDNELSQLRPSMRL